MLQPMPSISIFETCQDLHFSFTRNHSLEENFKFDEVANYWSTADQKTRSVHEDEIKAATRLPLPLFKYLFAGNLQLQGGWYDLMELRVPLMHNRRS
jgi:hypothetical protein